MAGTANASASVDRSCAPQAAPPRSFEEFERLLMRLVVEEDRRSTPCAVGGAGHRAASLARRAGACDHLITAALAHDFACHFHGLDEGCAARCSASLLVDVFPEQVLEPIRRLDREPDGAPVATAAARHAIAQERRLRAYVHAARNCSDEALLSWQALLKIARRTSLDG